MNGINMNKTIAITTGIGLFILTGIAATGVPKETDNCENCKVIPKNIDDDQMERIMYQYTRQLGVTCSYCHPDTKQGVFPVRVDFVSDEKPEKRTARKMMLMTDKLNKKYFSYSNDYSFESLSPHAGITCNTCHRGITKPNTLRLYFNE
jgi:hypothetical protein